jgi:acetylglutamate kinase
VNVRVYKVGGPALEDATLVAPLAAEIRAATGGRCWCTAAEGASSGCSRSWRSSRASWTGGARRRPPQWRSSRWCCLGLTNKGLAAALTEAGLPAVGVSGRDAGLIRARLEPGLGQVGTPESVDTRVLDALWGAGLVPVVSPVSGGPGARR